jgi:tetratricopeptide (TPR) repeat protein
MNGNYAEARKGANMLAANVTPHVKEMPGLEGFLTVPIAVDLRFHRWDNILQMKPPDDAMPTLSTFWHFARGVALASTGKIDDAEAEQKIVAEAESKTPPDAIFNMPIDNKTKDILKIAENILAAKIALAKKDNVAAIALLQNAVKLQDSLKYNEPPDWFFPVREPLGAVLLINGNNAEAEQVFREDLERNPRNPRSLFGLEHALKAQGKNYDAGFIGNQFRSSWKGGVAPLKVEDLI